MLSLLHRHLRAFSHSLTMNASTILIIDDQQMEQRVAELATENKKTMKEEMEVHHCIRTLHSVRCHHVWYGYGLWDIGMVGIEGSTCGARKGAHSTIGSRQSESKSCCIITRSSAIHVV
jgi:hypothetical protein